MSFVTYFLDTFQNFVTGLGMQGIDASKSVQYVLNLLDRATLENMYRGDWLARKICDQPAEDMTREWRSWQASQQQIEAIETVEKTIDLRRKVKQWIIKARLYGGAALVVGVDDGNAPSEPIDLNKCGKDCLKYVVVLHRYELNAGPRIYNVNDPYYTRAAFYTVATPMFGFSGENMGTTMPTRTGQPEQVPGSLRNFMSNVIPFGKRGQTQYPNTTPTNIGLEQIHPSRVLELPGNELPDWRLAPLGGGWGDSVLQTTVDTVNSFTTTCQSISAMVADGKMDVIKIPDMALKMATPGGKDKMIERFALSARVKSVISALLIDKEEEWNRISTNYSGLPMVMHEFITLVAGAADIPVSILFGQAYGRGMQGGSTGGAAAGGDSEAYYARCASEQKNEIAPRLGMLDQVMMRSAIGKEDPNISFEWNPLWQMKDAEKAQVAFQKAQATQIYAGIGIINEDAFREGVVNQLIEDGTYPGLDDAIEEFGAEPEEPPMLPGMPTAGGGGGGGAPQIPGQPNPKQIGHSGPMGDRWSPEARAAAAEAKHANAKNADHQQRKADKHNREADETDDPHERALHRMKAASHQAAAEAFRRGDSESGKLHAAVAHSMMRDGDAPGHPFRGNQHTGGIGGDEPELPLTGGRMRHETKKFLMTKEAGAAVTAAVKDWAAKHTKGATEHIVLHEAELAVIGAVGAGLVSLGVPAIAAAGAAAVAGYAMEKIAHKLGINGENAHRLLQAGVRKLREVRETAARMGAHSGSHFPTTPPFSFGFADADDPVLMALRLMDHALSTHTTAQLSECAARHPVSDGDFEGHPFRGNQYTSGQGGGGEEPKGDHPGHGYSKDAYVDKAGVIHTDNVDDAVLALYEEKKVELNQVKEVSTLLDKLGKIAQEARAKGEKALVYDLCNVSVKGTNLFCAESHGIKRIQMPQFKDKAQQDEFTKYISDKYKTTETQEFASHLRATQSELNGGTVAYKMSQFRKSPAKADEPIIVSRDNYILDGHHGWAANIGIDAEDGKLDSGKKMNVLRVDIGTIQLLQEANKFTGKKGRKGIADRRWFMRDYSESQPRGKTTPGSNSGSFAPKQGGLAESVLSGSLYGEEALQQVGAQTGGTTEPPGGRKASPGVPDSLVQAIEDHVNAMGGEASKHGAADLSEWIMRAHRKEILALTDASKDKWPILLLHKGDPKIGMPTVWMLTWSKNDNTSIHDHLESEVGVSVARGRVGNRVYSTGEGYVDKAKSKEGLDSKTGEQILGRNQTLQIKAPYIHEMFGTAEPGSKRDVTVHAYFPPLKQMHYFRKDTKGRLHYAGDWDEDRNPEDVMVADALRGMGGGCPCCCFRMMDRRKRTRR